MAPEKSPNVLFMGYDCEKPVSEQNSTKNELKGGSVHFVTINVEGKQISRFGKRMVCQCH
jgi:hypothetical protein